MTEYVYVKLVILESVIVVVLPMDEIRSIWLWIIFHEFRLSVGVELVINW